MNPISTPSQSLYTVSRLRKSQIETGLFEPGLAENFDTQMVWPAGMGLTRVGSVDVAVESFSKVRKAVQVLSFTGGMGVEFIVVHHGSV